MRDRRGFGWFVALRKFFRLNATAGSGAERWTMVSAWGVIVPGEQMSELPRPISIAYSSEIDRRWRLMLMSFFIRRTRDRSEAEDLTQETLARGAKCTDIGDSGIRAYLFTIAANLLRDRARRARSHQTMAHTSFSDPSIDSDNLAAEEVGQERVLISKERLEKVMGALSELDERTRDIFVLFRLEKMKQKDIAVLLGISVSAVEKHVVKAATHLQTRFKENS